MIRFLLPVLIFILAASPLSIAAADPVCPSGCSSGNICVFTNVAETQTGCIPAATDGEVSEIVVEASPNRNNSGTLANFVDNTVIPIVDGGIIPFLYALAFIFFLWGCFLFFFTGGEENREKGKKFVVWGLVALVVLFSVWGIIRLLLNTLQLGT